MNARIDKTFAALADGAMAKLKRWLAETKAILATQLSGFKAHVEKKRK